MTIHDLLDSAAFLLDTAIKLERFTKGYIKASECDRNGEKQMMA